VFQKQSLATGNYWIWNVRQAEIPKQDNQKNRRSGVPNLIYISSNYLAF